VKPINFLIESILILDSFKKSSKVKSYQNALDVVKKLHVVNDPEGIGTKLIKYYNNLVSKSEQKQLVPTEVVSDYRSNYPDCKSV